MRHKVRSGMEGQSGYAYFLEITKTPIPNQQTVILNESLRWILHVSSTLRRLGKVELTSGAKMTLSIVSN
jgi:hypothetical protein